jgi:hypothetical protein
MSCEKCGAKFGERHGVECLRELNDQPVEKQKLRAKWPLKCDASGVHPKQIKSTMAKAKQLGVPTEFTRDGRTIFRDPSHRRRYLKAMKFYDRAAYY